MPLLFFDDATGRASMMVRRTANKRFAFKTFADPGTDVVLTHDELDELKGFIEHTGQTRLEEF